MAELIARIQDNGPRLSEEKILAFESEIGCRLPADYREFLSSVNGGSFGSEEFWIGDFGLACFGGLREEEEGSLMANRDCYQVSEDRIPKDLLWIADDSFGNAACIGLVGERRGKIYFWEHEGETVDLMADSFTDFVTGLGQPDEAEDDSDTSSRFVFLMGVLLAVALPIGLIVWFVATGESRWWVYVLAFCLPPVAVLVAGLAYDTLKSRLNSSKPHNS